MEQLLKEYKKLSNNIKEHLTDIRCFNSCYNRDKNISDEMVVFITSLAKECWLKDNYSFANAHNYAEYLLSAIYDYQATQKQLEELSPYDIIEKFNNKDSPIELLKLDTSDMDFLCRTTDNLNYYCDEDETYIVDAKGMQVGLTIAEPIDEIFSLLEKNKIAYMPLSTHYIIRDFIKNDIYGDEELEKEYKNSITSYMNYCKERFITSHDILRALKKNTNINIDLTEEDTLYSEKRKMVKLNIVKNVLSEKDTEKYSYVASLDNGIDYYFYNNKYIAVDEHYVTKEFENKDLFLLHELKGHKFAYLSESESKKIADSLTEKYFGDGSYNKIPVTNLRNYLKYENDKELNSFDNKFVPSILTVYLSKDESKENVKESLNKKSENEYQKDDSVMI